MYFLQLRKPPGVYTRPADPTFKWSYTVLPMPYTLLLADTHVLQKTIHACFIHCVLVLHLNQMQPSTQIAVSG